MVHIFICVVVIGYRYGTYTLLLKWLNLKHCISLSGYFQIKVSHETRSVECDA